MEWAVELGEVTLLGDFDKDFEKSLKCGDSMAKALKAFDYIHARNGVITACHPRSKVYWHTEKRLGVDGIEVWNGIGWKTWDIDALAWWHRLLTEGEQITAMGASDAHTFAHPIQCPVNLVYAKSNQSKDVLAAVKAGRVMVLGGPALPRIYLTADANRDGHYDDAMAGDTLSQKPSEPVRFEVKIEKANGNHRLMLFDRNGEFYNQPVGCGDGWNGNVYRFERSFSADVPNFVRAEVRKSDGKEMETISNPIYWKVEKKAK
jgi:hypothetical protein